MRSIPCAILMAALAGCGEEARVAPVAPAAELAASLETSESQNAVLFPKTAHPYGASVSTWADRESQWVYGHPLGHNPLIAGPGAHRIAAAGDRGRLLHDVQVAGAGRAHTPSLRHRCPGRQQDLCLSLERSVIRAAPRRSPTCTVA